MDNPVDLLEQAHLARDLAVRAERLAEKAADPAERARILRYAASLRDAADALEARSRAAASNDFQ